MLCFYNISSLFISFFGTCQTRVLLPDVLLDTTTIIVVLQCFTFLLDRKISSISGNDFCIEMVSISLELGYKLNDNSTVEA